MDREEFDKRWRRKESETIDRIIKNLQLYLFDIADNIYNNNEKYISKIKYFKLKTNYSKEYQAIIKDQIVNCLETYRFSEAEDIYKTNIKYISEKNFLILQEPYLPYIIKERIDFFLERYEFDEVDKIYEINRTYISEENFIAWRQQYLKKQLESFLKCYQFEEADNVYVKNTLYMTKDVYVDMKNIYINKHIMSQKISESFNKNGLLSTNIFFKTQSILTSEEYYAVCKSEIQKFFSQAVKSIPINEEQLEAIREIESHVLLKARAGSGKTAVATLKTFFLIEHEKIHPDQIMMLAFNKKAAAEILNRIREQYGIIEFHNARTFHSLAYQLVQPKESLLFDEGDQNATQKQSKLIQEITDTIIKEASSQRNIYTFFRQAICPLESDGDFLSKEEYYFYRRNYKYVTLQGDCVKSLGEKYIGDFLFEYGIEYEYEKTWGWEQRNYKPDFTLYINGKTIVIEFWGIDEKNTSKSLPAHWTTTWDDYKATMKKKRSFWKEKPYVEFIELSIVDLKDTTRKDFEKLITLNLIEKGIHPQKLSEKEIIQRLLETKNRASKLAKMFLQFIQKAKKQRISPDEIIPRINQIDNRKERIRFFSETANEVYRRYVEELKKNNNIDFDDLIERAISLVHESKGTCSINIGNSNVRYIKLIDLKYLFIDEYQDFSLLFYELVNAIRQYNPNLKLFCVGDDWQAINAFAGSNLKFFNNFNSYITPSGYKRLLTNFRSSSDLVELANCFMEGKGDKSVSHLKPTGLIFKCYTNQGFIEDRPKANNSPVDMLKVCLSIITNKDNRDKTIGILSRNNITYGWDLQTFMKRLKKEVYKEVDSEIYKNFDKNIKVTTTHGFKGLEADIIIMLNVNNGQYPNIHPDNELYEIFGETPADILAGEERLFYVGITRAKIALYILCDKDNESEYLKRFNLPEYKIKPNI